MPTDRLCPSRRGSPLGDFLRQCQETRREIESALQDIAGEPDQPPTPMPRPRTGNTRPLRRPDGWLVEEYVTSSAHRFHDGRLVGHHNDAGMGWYTGRFCFEFADHHRPTPWYTTKTAPRWLRALYAEATTDYYGPVPNADAADGEEGQPDE